MVDYIRQISGSTQLMIRDTGGNVEFWIKTGSQSWNNNQPWSYFANGGESGTRQFRLVAGGNWQMMGAVYVGYNQTVRFSVTGTGIGFPSYDFYQDIGRSTVPRDPFIWDTHAISSSDIRVQFYSNGDGGSPILEYLIGFGTNPNAPEYGWPADSFSEDVGPFGSGVRIYFWARARNSVGWGPWGNRTEARTWSVPDAPGGVTFDDVDQTSVVAHFNDAYDGGTDITARQLGYSLTSSSPTTTVSATSGPNSIGSLSPGKIYYFWARSQNSIGWGAWSPVAQVQLIAGARIYTGGQWKRAVPYVKVAGTWKVVRPWIRTAGEWKETSL